MNSQLDFSIQKTTKISLFQLTKDDFSELSNPYDYKWLSSIPDLINMFKESMASFRLKGIHLTAADFFAEIRPDLRHFQKGNHSHLVESISNGYFQKVFVTVTNKAKMRYMNRTARKTCNFDYLVPGRLKAKGVVLSVQKDSMEISDSSRTIKRKMKVRFVPGLIVILILFLLNAEYLSFIFFSDEKWEHQRTARN